MSIKASDKVQVIRKNDRFDGKQGTVVIAADDGQTFAVTFEDGTTFAYFLSEIKPVDGKREALIELAETLDKARLQANAIELVAGQGSVYGMASSALISTLAYITDGYGQRVYEDMLESGNTVREALAVVEK